MDHEIRRTISEIKASIGLGDLAIFCGAGLSFNSGIPLAGDLIRHIMGVLGASASDVEHIMNSSLPFESFIDILNRHSDVGALLNIFKHGKPNTNHALLAKLAKMHFVKLIVTTNFDTLIEQAFQLEGMLRGVHYEVFYKDEDWYGATQKDDRIRLVKIHGSIEDQRSMVITIQRVAYKTWSEHRERVIQYLLRDGPHTHILVLGYSCSDEFDITPAIEHVSDSDKCIVFIDHSMLKSETKNIASKQGKNPFRHFDHGTLMISNTDHVVEMLWTHLLPSSDYQFVKNTDELWRLFVEDWVTAINNTVGIERQYEILAALFQSTARPKKALDFTTRILEHAKQLGDRSMEASCLSRIGCSHLSLGDFNAAISTLHQAVLLSRSFGTREELAQALTNLGIAYKSIGGYPKAIGYYEEALPIALETNLHELGIKLLGNLGVAHMELADYGKATTYIEMGLHVAKEDGFKGEEASLLDNLGNIYYATAHFADAIHCYDQSLDLARKVGAKDVEANTLVNTGVAYGRLNRLTEAMRYYQLALLISHEIGDRSREASIYGNMGDNCFLQGDYRNAQENYTMAIAISKEFDNRPAEAHWLGAIGNVYLRLGDCTEATTHYSSALNTVRSIGDKRGEGYLLVYMGNAYVQSGRPEIAVNWYRQALIVLEEIHDGAGAGNALGNMACAYANLSDYISAVDCCKRALNILSSVLPMDHPNVQMINANLARCLTMVSR